MNKLIILKGLPACGKSTYAKELVDKGYKRVNKDEIRLMVDNGKWSKANEKLVQDIEFKMVVDFLEKGHNVVVDDTNFAWVDFWIRTADENNASEWEVKEFDTSLGECIDRDIKRDKSVGADVINKMFEKYIYKPIAYDESLPDCYIFDIDGTLATMNGRSPYDYTKVHTDKLNVPVVRVFDSLKGMKKFIFSGRVDDCRGVTYRWLADNGVYHDGLYMRESKDKRNDAIVKKEMYEKYIKGKFNVLGVFDDRQRVCRMWYELGVPLFRVGNPDSNF